MTPTQYDIHWIEDAIYKANTELSLTMCKKIMTVIDWGESLQLRMIEQHLSKDIKIKLERLKEQDADDSNTSGIKREARKSSG